MAKVKGTTVDERRTRLGDLIEERAELVEAQKSAQAGLMAKIAGLDADQVKIEQSIADLQTRYVIEHLDPGPVGVIGLDRRVSDVRPSDFPGDM